MYCLKVRNNLPVNNNKTSSNGREAIYYLYFLPDQNNADLLFDAREGLGDGLDLVVGVACDEKVLRLRYVELGIGAGVTHTESGKRRYRSAFVFS